MTSTNLWQVLGLWRVWKSMVDEWNPGKHKVLEYLLSSVPLILGLVSTGLGIWARADGKDFGFWSVPTVEQVFNAMVFLRLRGMKGIIQTIPYWILAAASATMGILVAVTIWSGVDSLAALG